MDKENQQMKLFEFEYTKATGATSNRAVIMFQEPTQNFSGVDVSELDEPDFAAFVSEYRTIKNRQHEEMLELMAKHDLKHNYRQFIPDRMRVQTVELL